MVVKQFEKSAYLEFTYVVGLHKNGLFQAVGFRGDEWLCKTTTDAYDEVVKDVKSQLKKLSTEYVGMEEAIKRFNHIFFDGGLHSPLYHERERGPKIVASDLAVSVLAKERFEDCNSLEDYRKHFSQISGVVKKASFMLSPFEVSKFSGNIPEKGIEKAFCEALHDLLYGGNFDLAFGGYVKVLESADVRTWPVATLLPFMFSPKKYMFLKPEVTQDCAQRMGWDLKYEAAPNNITYSCLIEFAEYLKNGMRELGPQDYIDVQSLIFAVSYPPYKEQIEKYRQEKEGIWKTCN